MVWFASSWLCLHVLYRFFIIFLSPKVKYSCELFEHEEQHHKRCEGGLLCYTHMSTLVSVRLLSFYFGGSRCVTFLVKTEHSTWKFLYFENYLSRRRNISNIAKEKCFSSFLPKMYGQNTEKLKRKS